jgi:hypothetical protein
MGRRWFSPQYEVLRRKLGQTSAHHSPALVAVSNAHFTNSPLSPYDTSIAIDCNIADRQNRSILVAVELKQPHSHPSMPDIESLG